MTTSFFSGTNVAPEADSTNALIDNLTSQVATVTAANSQAQAASVAAAASANNAKISEANVSTLAQQSTTTLNQANAAVSQAQALTTQASTAVTTATNSATQAASSASQAATSLTSVQNAVAPFLSPQAQYIFTATAGQTSWAVPNGATFVPGTSQVFVNGIRYNRTESYDDSTGNSITFVNPLPAGYEVTVLFNNTVVFPVTGASVADLALAQSTKGADMVGFVGANGTATTVSALASTTSGKGSSLIAHGTGNLGQTVGNLQARLGASFDFQSAKNASQAYTRFFAISGSARNQPQGFAVDEAARRFYVFFGYDSTIAQFELDGPLGQLALSASLTTTRLGHSGLTLEYSTSGSKLWAPSANSGKALRFSYVAGAQPDNSQEYQFFTDDGSGTNYTSVSITDDQQYLVAVSPWPAVVRVYSLATLVASGPGDYRNSYLYQWTVPTDQFPGGPGVTPIQAHVGRGSVFYILAGLGTNNAPCSIYGYDIQTGLIVSRGDSLPIGTADAAKVEAGNYNEPEGIAFVDGKIAVLCTQGATSGRRSNRIYLCSKKPSASEQSAQAMSRWNSAFSGARYSSSRQALIKSVLDELIENGLYDRLSFLYLANTDANGAAINLVNPTQKLITNGTVTFTADRGWKSDGTTGYLDTGVSPMTMPNNELNSACYGGYILGTSTSAQVLGLTSGTGVAMTARSSGGNFSTRLNQTAADNYANTNAVGHFLSNRSGSASYDKYINGSLVKTVTAAADTFLSTGNVALLNVNGTLADANMQLAAAHGGLSLTPAQVTALYNVITRYLHELGAV
ncbi:hypothetical protein AWB76_07222 [Caballeronia temeraria]|uniref:Uncharacterized protein n=1 Tax=Caballeronia temeraria TaxID=1777137 RepID=A0A158DMZ1_9BURK|nr:hypothetical protein [Caballeronia temeraria]SAK95935.1 hypothetical protein AWB76_07222 [Caballeronia temeraria]